MSSEKPEKCCANLEEEWNNIKESEEEEEEKERERMRREYGEWVFMYIYQYRACLKSTSCNPNQHQTCKAKT